MLLVCSYVYRTIVSKEMREYCSESVRIIVQNPDVFLVGVTQSLFEGVIFVFVFIWTPTLNPANPPLGIVFACFMICYGQHFIQIPTPQLENITRNVIVLHYWTILSCISYLILLFC